ncbi:MAG: NnrU family protein [Hyphomicrobiaceae bacterium]|nr:NnrU family protein [Hyphomicrobiaceae bacterium]
MLLLVAGLVLFLGAHTVPMLPSLRARLEAGLSVTGYKAAFTAVSIVGLVLIVIGYGEMQGQGRLNPELYTPPVFMRHLNLLLMLPALILIVAAYVPSRIRDGAKHPMLAAVKLWAFGHLLANGDLASVLLFGSFLVWAVADRISVKRRAALGPLGARKGGPRGDLIAIGIGSVLYAWLLLGGHRWLFGVAPLPSIG